jgi:hypothetical protein
MGGMQTLGHVGEAPPRGQQPAPVPPEADDDARAGLSRSVEKIQVEVEETARRAVELKKDLQRIRARVDALLAIPGPAVGKQAVARIVGMLQPNPAQTVAEVADVLKRHPPRPSARRGDSLQLYMKDLVAGGTTLLADEALPGMTFCSSAKWSHDGSRIVFDVTPDLNWQQTHLMMLEVRNGRPSLTDLGPGNCPNFSRDDKKIAFLTNPGAVPGAEAGIWVMQADGSRRKLVHGTFGTPFWSEDGREFLISTFSTPAEATVINLETVKAGIVAVPGYRLFSWPRWAGPGRMVACLGTGAEAEMVALLDVRDPAAVRIIEALWKRGQDLDLEPRWPLYRPETGRCFFTGVDASHRQTLFSVKRGESAHAPRMEAEPRPDRVIAQDFSPDGRYLLFSANRPEGR